MESKIKAANFETSPRLQRFWRLLKDGQWHSTREIAIKCEIYHAGTAAAEMRKNGFDVVCVCLGKTKQKRMLYKYKLNK